jgi:hypothetical protein
MAVRIASLPPNFRAFETLTVCGNVMHNGIAPFLFGDTVPLLIGVGEKTPLLWLAAPKDPRGSDWTELVVANEAKLSMVRIYPETEKGEVAIAVSKQIVLECRQVNDRSAEITLLDLKPCNLNLVGTRESLSVGTNQFTHNSFAGTAYMMKLG